MIVSHDAGRYLSGLGISVKSLHCFIHRVNRASNRSQPRYAKAIANTAANTTSPAMSSNTIPASTVITASISFLPFPPYQGK